MRAVKSCWAVRKTRRRGVARRRPSPEAAMGLRQQLGAAGVSRDVVLRFHACPCSPCLKLWLWVFGQ